MIRRKLTRIEVTLDDTKDLDDYFSKASQPALANTTSATTPVAPSALSKTPSQLYQLYTKNYGCQSTLDLSLDQQATLGTTSSNRASTADNANNTINNGSDSISTLVTNSNSTDQQSAEAERLSYNPQPYNQSSRFNQNS